MKIAISKLPSLPWWGNGIIGYKDNPAMKNGFIPNQKILENERKNLINTLKKNNLEIVEFNFPKKLENARYGHDFVFIRDGFISNLKGKMLLLNFSQVNRTQEIEFIANSLEKFNYKIEQMSGKRNSFAEGGEFHYCPKEKILFSGISRNSILGAEEVASFLNINKLVIIETKAFHLDTIFTTIFDKNGNLSALAIVKDLITKNSMTNLKKLANTYNLKILQASESDSIGSNELLGNFAINTFSAPGLIISSNYFSDPKIKNELNKLEIKHEVIPVSQYQLSGGSVHCLTNEL